MNGASPLTPKATKSYRRRSILLVVLPLVLLLALWVWLLIAIGAFDGGPNADSFGTDFAMFYSAAQVTRDGGNPYDQTQLYRTEHTLMQRANVKLTSARYVRVANPPLFFWLLGPLTRLPYKLAAYLWIAVMYALAATGALLALRGLGWKRQILPLLLFLAMPQVMLDMYYANVDGLEFLSVAGGLLLQRRSPFLGGALLSVAWVKPQIGLPLVMLIALFHTRNLRQMLAGFLGGSAALLVVPVAFLPVNAVSHWIQGMNGFRHYTKVYSDIASLTAAFSGVGSEYVSTLLEAVAILGAGAMTAVCWYRTRGRHPLPVLDVAWLWALWMLVTPQLHFHDELVLAIPVFALVGPDAAYVTKWPAAAALYIAYFSILGLAFHPLGAQWLWVPILLLIFCLRSGRDLTGPSTQTDAVAAVAAPDSERSSPESGHTGDDYDAETATCSR